VVSAEDVRSGILLPTNLSVIDRLLRQPTEIFSLSSWEFQEFVAELLSRSGYRVKLGSRGPDNGIDIFAERPTEVGVDLALVQCKRNAPGNKVARAVVKELYGTVEEKRATRGLIVTTSTFTAPALDFIERLRYRVAGQDFDKLQAWLHRVRGADDDIFPRVPLSGSSGAASSTCCG
jgi:restriction system protein